ncbi:MAG: DegT/DnrJ/EryC1/StrS family aminotransferase [Candidatus Eisenbacteria bacterium]
MKVPQFDIARQYRSMKTEIGDAVDEVLESGQYVLGKWVKDIELAVARATGARHGIGVASGTDALALALIACDVGPGDEVITSPFSFVSVAEVAIRMGAKPVFVDIDRKTFNIDPGDLKKKITDRTRAIIPVHLYGQSADMDAVMRLVEGTRIAVIEDAAQAIGARYKDKPVCSIGTMSCLSFYPTKNLGCFGDGGMVLTNDDSLADRAESLRRHGQSEKYKYRFVGLNSRLDSLQAAILLAKFGKLKTWTEARRKVASRYDELLASTPVETPYVSDFAYHVYHQYTILTDARDDLRAFLAEKGIGTATHYPIGLHLQEAYADLGYKEGDLPNCDWAAERVISLPMFPELEEKEVDYVGESIQEFFKNG